MSALPKVGDIWERYYHSGDKAEHILIVRDDYEMSNLLEGRKGYQFVILETGEQDSAWLEHFIRFCRPFS